MDAREIFDAYFRFFAEQGPTAFADYVRSPLWTPRATTALVHVGLKAFPAGEPAAKGYAGQNQWNRSEYLCLDVAVVDPQTWGAPLFVAEHENSRFKAQVQYCAWKLLSVEAQRRVLVAYWGEGTEFKHFDALREAVKEVCAGQPSKDILLIGGNYAAKPTTIDEFRDTKVHDTAIVGVHATA
jgi:hypothetical protein